MRKQHKYRAKPTVVDGIRFASMKEARRFQELKLLEKAGEIRDLKLQPSFVLMAPVYKDGSALSDVNQGIFERVSPIGQYRADFSYEARFRSIWHPVVEDAKGFRTQLYIWKKRHVERQYGITIREV